MRANTLAEHPRSVNGLSIFCVGSEHTVTITALALLHALSTLTLTGLVWFVQLVHYPLFARLEGAAGAAYAREHVRRTSGLVTPVMVIEAGSAVALLWVLRGTAAAWLAATGLGLLVLIWTSTAVWQWPLHQQLARDFAAADVARLVRTNWVRTAAWTARTVIALALLDALSRHP